MSSPSSLVQRVWRPLLVAPFIAAFPLFAVYSEWGGSTTPALVVVGQRQFEVTLHYAGLGDSPFYERTWAEVASRPNQPPPTAAERQAAIERAMADIALNPAHWGRLGPEGRRIHWDRVANRILPSSSVLALIVLGVWIAYDFHRTSQRRQPGHCPKCGYDLAGLAEPAAPCPECGARPWKDER